jgi:hypothetical protein
MSRASIVSRIAHRGSASLPPGYNLGRLYQTFKHRRYYEALADSGDPERFFVEPPKGIAVRSQRVRFPGSISSVATSSCSRFPFTESGRRGSLHSAGTGSSPAAYPV